MLSADRQAHWVHLIVDGLLKKSLVVCKDKDAVIRAALRAMALLIKEHQEIENKVRQKITSLKREVPAGSSEWEVLYARYYEEELSRSHLESRK